MAAKTPKWKWLLVCYETSDKKRDRRAEPSAEPDTSFLVKLQVTCNEGASEREFKGLLVTKSNQIQRVTQVIMIGHDYE